MLIPHDEFPVRPKTGAGESLAGYIKRLYFSNGYPLPQRCKDALANLYAGEEIEDAFRLLQGVVGESSTVDRDYWITERLDASSPLRAPPKWLKLEYNNCKFCPECLIAANYHFGVWELPLFHACPLHHCTLLKACSSCGKLLTWASMGLGWKCQCGASIKSMATTFAPQWTVGLSALMVGAADARIPETYTLLTLAVPSRATVYSLGAIFDSLAWAYDLRKSLKRRKWFRAGTWPARVRPSTRAEPRAWEVRTLASSPLLLHPVLSRFFKWNFRDRRPDFLMCSSDDPLAQGLHLLAATRQSENEFLAQLYEAVTHVLAERRAPLSMCTNVYFHPSRSRDEVNFGLSALATWWYEVSNRTPLLDQGSVLLAVEARFDHHRFFSGNPTEDIVAILNELIDCATADVKADRLWKLTARWHVPANLRRKLDPSEVMEVIANYLRRITSGERAFILALLVDAPSVGTT